jgi:hypothetical protein
MLGPALSRLYLDLEAIKETKRTSYEQALYDELFQIAQRATPVGSPPPERAALRPLLNATASPKMVVDLGGGRDSESKPRCPAPTCPYKER